MMLAISTPHLADSASGKGHNQRLSVHAKLSGSYAKEWVSQVPQMLLTLVLA